MTNTDTITETPDYFLTVGRASSDDTLVYQVISKKYEVVEVETSILPQALKYIGDLQMALDNTLNPQVDPLLDQETTSEVIAFNKNKLN